MPMLYLQAYASITERVKHWQCWLSSLQAAPAI